MSIAVLLERLISKRYYADKTDIENKLNVFYAMSKISDEEYSDLVLKVEDVYVTAEENSSAEETIIEENTEITE